MFFEEERLGPAALEARGDRCMASGRRRQLWNFAISNDYEDAACAYILAENCRFYFYLLLIIGISLQIPNLS
jgi:hypothetical protein